MWNLTTTMITTTKKKPLKETLENKYQPKDFSSGTAIKNDNVH